MGLLKCCLEWGQRGPGGTERPGGSQDPVVRGGTQNTSSLWVLLTSRPGWVGTLWAESAAGWGCGKDGPAGRTGVTGAVDRGAVWTREFWERCKYRLLEHRDPKVGLWLCVAAEGKGRGRGRGGQEGRGVIGGRTGQGVAGRGRHGKAGRGQSGGGGGRMVSAASHPTGAWTTTFPGQSSHRCLRHCPVSPGTPVCTPWSRARPHQRTTEQ